MVNPPLTDLAALTHLLHQYDIHPNRTAGQNFLICHEVIEATLLTVKSGPNLITELGAGLGTVTLPLAAAGYQVQAIERDPALASVLKNLIPKRLSSQVEVIPADLRHCQWTKTEPYQIVGNIPYNLSGLIIRRLTQLDPAPAQVVLLLQKEVGDRLLAQPPAMHLLSLAAQSWAAVHHLLDVPPTCFWPAPAVTSSLLLLLPHEPARLSLPAREALLATAKPFFQQRRKQLAGTLRRVWHKDDVTIARLLAVAGIPLTARPQELSLAQWQRLQASL